MAQETLTELNSIGSVALNDLMYIVDVNNQNADCKIDINTLGSFIIANKLQGNAVGNISMSSHSINMNTGSGAGGGNIYMDGGSIAFPGINGSYGLNDYGSSIQTGSFNNEKGASGGISMICSVGFELNWQAGWLSSSYNSGLNFVNINLYNSGINFQGNNLNMGGGNGTNGGGIYCDGGKLYNIGYDTSSTSLQNSQFNFSYNESSDNFTITVKKSDGTIKTATVTCS